MDRLSKISVEISTKKVARVLLVLIFLFWLAIIRVNSKDLPEIPPGDFQRDTAIVHNIVEGNIFKDHAYLGEYEGYPYLAHLLVAFFHKITKIPIETLLLNYPQVILVPAALLFIFSVWKIFRSALAALMAFFSLVFVMPQTGNHMYVFAHPHGLALGTFALGIWLFWRAICSERRLDYVWAGLGIALAVWSEPFVGFTLCGGIVLYQLVTRRNWQNFVIMVATSFVLASPYIFPLVFVYKMKTINSLLCPYVPRELGLDWILFGYERIRWFNCFLIMTGLAVAFYRRSKLDKFLMAMFFFSHFFVVWGLLTTQIKALARFEPPVFIVWQDIGETNQFVAIFLLVIGLRYWLKQLPLQFRFIRRPERATLALFLFVFGFYSLTMLPRFVKKVTGWYPSQRIYFPYDENWQATTAWIKKNTSIYDVFLAHSGPSYLFVGGMTGRKVVITDNHHSNAFVDQAQRVQDHWLMYQTTDLATFLKLARKYQVSYLITSPYDWQLNPKGLKRFPDQSVFKPVFSSGPVTVYQLGENK